MSRISYDDLPNQVVIRIAAPKQTGALLFLPVWWAFWTFGVVAVSRELITSDFYHDGGPFLLLWLIAALAAWFIVPTVWLWWLFGYEEIVVRNGTLTVARRLFRFRKSHAYSAKEVRELRASGYFGDPWKKNWGGNGFAWGTSGGMVAFREAGLEQRFGINLEEHEAQRIVDRLKPYIPNSG